MFSGDKIQSNLFLRSLDTFKNQSGFHPSLSIWPTTLPGCDMEISVLQYCSGLEPNTLSTLEKMKLLFSILKMQMAATQGKPHEIDSTCFAQIWLYNAAGLTDVLHCWDNGAQLEHTSELNSEATISINSSCGLRKYFLCSIVIPLLEEWTIMGHNPCLTNIFKSGKSMEDL